MRRALLSVSALIWLLSCAPAQGLREAQPLPVNVAPGAALPVVALSRAKPLIDVSSAVALAHVDDRLIAFVADEDEHLVRIVDVGQRRELSRTAIDGAPSDVLVLRDGRIAVSVRDRGKVVTLAPKGEATHFEVTSSVDVAAEPTGLATTPDGATLLVASRWGQALSLLDANTLSTRTVVLLPRDPRAVVASADGSQAFVTHATGGRLSVVDLDGSHAVHDLRIRQDHEVQSSRSWGKMMMPEPPVMIRRTRFGGQGFAIGRAPDGRVLAPVTLTDPGQQGSATGYGSGGGPSVVFDVAMTTSAAAVKLSEPWMNGADCLLPRGVAYDSVRKVMLVACQGINAVIAYPDAANLHASTGEGYHVAAGPTGIAADSAARVAVVWSAFDRALAVLDLDAPAVPRPVARATLTFPASAPLDSVVATGRALFHDAGPQHHIASDGRACASCHPDGRDDGLTWFTPEGPRQTPMLVGRLEGTAPYGWDGEKKDWMSHLGRTLERLGAKRINAAERESLFAYVATLKPPSIAKVDAAKGDDHRAAGEALFFSERVGCAGCHAGDATTDGLAHDVKSRVPSEARAAFDTPSLRFVGRSAPYFHDGRYASLGALLRGTAGTMGHPERLSKAEASDLRGLSRIALRTNDIPRNRTSGSIGITEGFAMLDSTPARTLALFGISLFALVGCGGGGSGASGEGGSASSGTASTASSNGGNPNTNPDDGPPAGNPDGHCDVPADAALEDVSKPTTVVGTGTPASCTSAAVVAAVAAGGVITFDCGPDPVTITLTETAKIFNDKGPKIVIDGGGKVTLSGGGKVRILYQDTCDQAQVWTSATCQNQATPELTVQNLTFIDGNSTGDETEGGGGGEIQVRGGRFKIINSRFFHGQCDPTGPDLGGAAVRVLSQYNNLPVYVVNSTFGGKQGYGGSCSNGGGLSSIDVSYTVLNSLFSYNSAIGNGANPAQSGTPGGGSGGAIYNDGDTYTLTLCGVSMTNNTANEGGGAIFYVSNDGSGHLVIQDSTLENNPSKGFETAGYPGIFWMTNAMPTVTNSTIK